jgi:hypothetical protein
MVETLAVRAGGAVGPAPGFGMDAASVLPTVPPVPADVEFVVVVDDGSVCAGLANARPGMATAVPMPSASASAPVRPMQLANRILLGFFDASRPSPPSGERRVRLDRFAGSMS